MEKINILVVEDDPIIAADLKDRLEELDYAVMGPVASGEAALEEVKGSPQPDLVLMDIQLEGAWDGIETAAQIRQHKKLPLIFLTSNSDSRTFSRAKAVDPQAFFVETLPESRPHTRHRVGHQAISGTKYCVRGSRQHLCARRPPIHQGQRPDVAGIFPGHPLGGGRRLLL